MKITVEPPISRWLLQSPAGADRRELLEAIGRRALALGSGRLEGQRPLIATGHQAWLWHPGILAKDIAMAQVAAGRGASAFHLVVDQDTHEALRLELPVREGEHLRVETITLAPHEATVPTGWQPPVDARQVQQTIAQARRRLGPALLADPAPLAEAFAHLPACRTLAEQIAVVLLRLMEPYTGTLPLLFVSDLSRMEMFRAVVERMVHDARRCVEAYNRAVARHSQAEIVPLLVERDRVELPLWLLGWERPRQRVYADLSNSRPLLTLESGQEIDTTGQALAPRALLLTAMMRRFCCDLFIHGKGGWLYDRITEEWWRQWTGQELAPMALVSADLRLDFDAPLADEMDLQRAIWWAHHVPANVDRVLDGQAATAEAARKRVLLARMGDDRNRARRSRAFAEIHRINAHLAQTHPQVIAQARQQLDRARTGLANRQTAHKRDWCMALYPPEKLQALAEALRLSASA